MNGLRDSSCRFLILRQHISIHKAKYVQCTRFPGLTVNNLLNWHQDEYNHKSTLVHPFLASHGFSWFTPPDHGDTREFVCKTSSVRTLKPEGLNFDPLVALLSHEHMFPTTTLAGSNTS